MNFNVNEMVTETYAMFPSTPTETLKKWLSEKMRGELTLHYNENKKKWRCTFSFPSQVVYLTRYDEQVPVVRFLLLPPTYTVDDDFISKLEKFKEVGKWSVDITIFRLIFYVDAKKESMEVIFPPFRGEKPISAIIPIFSIFKTEIINTNPNVEGNFRYFLRTLQNYSFPVVYRYEKGRY